MRWKLYQEPDLNRTMRHIKQFPHCDSKVLHAPGECKYCDVHPDWQELREYWGIAFTGHSNETIESTDWQGNKITKVLIPCPSEWNRPVEVINRWHGNVAMTEEREKEMDVYFDTLRQELNKDGLLPNDETST